MTRFSSAQRRRGKMLPTESRTMRPWKALRIAVRIILYSFLTYLIVALLWCFLPSPVVIHNVEDAASILRAGKSLTRVYASSVQRRYDDQAFALEYTIHDPSSSSAVLEISGFAAQIPLLRPGYDSCDNGSEITQGFQGVPRIGEPSGATPPWFTFADSILLGWWIDRKSTNVTLNAKWTLPSLSDPDYEPGPASPELCRRRLEIHREIEPTGRIEVEGLLLLDIERIGEEDRIQIVKFGLEEGSDSPTWTYPIRAAIIVVLAPTSIFLNEWILPWFGTLGTVFAVMFGVFAYTFFIGAVVVSLWRCFGGPSLEVAVQRVQDRLDVWQETGRFRWMRIHLIQEGLDKFLSCGRVQSVLRVCKEGWHPERERERLARDQEEKDAGVEKGDGGVKIKIRI